MITVAPTLAFMADVYRMSTSGGPSSERFRAYTEAAADETPVHGYNPMTSKPVLGAVEQLIEIDAEGRLFQVANQTAARLGYEDDEVMHLTVAAQGMWTDRLATEVNHRLNGPDPGGVLLWFDEPLDGAAVDAEIAAQTARLIFQRTEKSAPTLLDVVDREGTALALAGERGSYDDGAAQALSVLSEDSSLSSKVAFLYGDEAADVMGFTPLGLGDHVGYHHAVALAAERLDDVGTRRPDRHG